MAQLSKETRAQIKLALAQGETIRKTARAFRVSPTTVKGISDELRNATGMTALDHKASRFAEAVERFGEATMEMLTAQAELLTDLSYLSNKTTEHVIAHTRFIRESFEGIIRLQANLSQRSGGAAALPESVVAEIVDA